MKRSISIISASVLLLAVSSQASVMVSNITATASTMANVETEFLGNIERIVDGSGMNAEGTEHAAGGWDNLWVGRNGDVVNTWVQLDLGASHDLESLKIWNGNTPGYLNRNISQGDIYVSNVAAPGAIPTDNASNSDWTLVVANQAFNLGTGSGGLAATDTFNLTGNTARFVAINVDANGGLDQYGNYVSLSEVQVIAIPEPATIGMVSAVAAGLLFIRRRLIA